MKHTWFRPPAYRQFSLDADVGDAPDRPDGTAARRLDGRASEQDAARAPVVARPDAEEMSRRCESEHTMHVGQCLLDNNTTSQSQEPLATERLQRNVPGRTSPVHAPQSAPGLPASDKDGVEQSTQVRTLVEPVATEERTHPPERRGAARSNLRNVRRRVERVFDRYGYYMAVGVCALMVFAGALIGTSGYAPSEEPQATRLTGEQVSDISSEQPSAGDGLLGEEVSASAASTGDAAPHSLERWPLEGQVLTAHSLDALIYQPTLGIYATHCGIDIAGSAGQVVVACADGEVVQCWRESLLGNVVEVRTEDGIVMRYGNLASLDQASEGMSVSAGDVLGAIGSSAMSESLMEPHLHFEVLVDGQSVSPEDWLPER